MAWCSLEASKRDFIDSWRGGKQALDKLGLFAFIGADKASFLLVSPKTATLEVKGSCLFTEKGELADCRPAFSSETIVCC